MKKLLSVMLALGLSLSLAACGESPGAEAPPETAAPLVSAAPKPTEKPEKPEGLEGSDQPLEPFQKTAVIEETVLYDSGGVKITATELTYSNYEAELWLLLENNTDKDLSFVSNSVGYSCNSVNGYMISEGYLNCDVAAGKKANDSIGISYSELLLHGISVIADLEVGIQMADQDFDMSYTGPCPLRTSAWESYDYSRNRYQETIISQAAMDEFGYQVLSFTQEPLYDESGVRLLSAILMTNGEGEILGLELENTTDHPVCVDASDLAVNGLTVYSDTWTSQPINAGKRGLVTVELDALLDETQRRVYGVQEVGRVSLSLTQKDGEGGALTAPAGLELTVPQSVGTYDEGGTELYSGNGLRILLKGIEDPPDDYDDDIQVFLLVENNSGRTIMVDDVYDSVSVNGFMTDYFFGRAQLRDGTGAALTLELRESSLEENRLTALEDIRDIELGLELKDGRTVVDAPTLVIQAN